MSGAAEAIELPARVFFIEGVWVLNARDQNHLFSLNDRRGDQCMSCSDCSGTACGVMQLLVWPTLSSSRYIGKEEDDAKGVPSTVTLEGIVIPLGPDFVKFANGWTAPITMPVSLSKQWAEKNGIPTSVSILCTFLGHVTLLSIDAAPGISTRVI